MEGNRRSSFKRRPNPFSEKGGNKRGKFGDQASENFHDSETVYQILCHSRKIGSVIGKGGCIVKALREETQAKITVADSVPGSEERVIIIYSPSTKKPVKHNNDMELQCAAQDALLKVHDMIVEEDVAADDNGNVVIARLLVPNNTVGCLLGKRGDVIQRLRSETGANIRVLPADQLPVCAMNTDELVQISAKPSVAKRALYEVSTLLHQNPRKDKPPSGFPMHPPRPQMTNLPPPMNPVWSERGSSARGTTPTRWRGDYGNEPSRFGPVDFDDEHAGPHGGEAPSEFSMKILCSSAKIGGVIGKGGSNVRQLQQETGTNIHVDDVSADSERVIRVSAFEASWNPRSQTIDAILILQDKTSDHSEKGTITTRLLIPSSKVGCILGQGGQIINEMRRRTRADIRIYSKEEKPKCAGEDEELVQVSGSYGVAKDALAEVASRLRARCLRDAKPGPEPAPAFSSRRNLPVERPSPGVMRGGRSGGYEPLKGGGREYEDVSYPPPSRDYKPYSHPAPPRDYDPPRSHPRDYEPYSHPVPPREYDPPRNHPRDHEPYSHPVPPREYKHPRNHPTDHEPYSHPVPSREYDPPRSHQRDHEPYSHPVPPREYESPRSHPRDCEPYSHPAPPREYDPPRSRPRDHDPYSHPAPPRNYEPYSHPGDHEPYSHPAPPREYEPPRSHPRDHEPYSHPVPPSRDYEPYSHPAPTRGYESHHTDYEPHGYPSPPRDYEPHAHGYPVAPGATGFPGAVDLKMPSGGRGSAMVLAGVRNASQVTTGIRLKVQDPYINQTYGDLQPREEEEDMNPPPYRNYPPPPPLQQGHYSESPYQY